MDPPEELCRYVEEKVSDNRRREACNAVDFAFEPRRKK